MPSIYRTLTTDAIGAATTLTTMLAAECETYRSDDYLSSGPADRVNEEDRAKIVDWAYLVVDHCQFSRETVSIAMDYVDRFMSSRSRLVHQILEDRRLYQLAAMGALYISIKLNERVAFSSEFFAAMSRGAYTVEEIEGMELSILRGLSWRVNPPTSLQMANHILSLTLPHTDVDEKTWGYILDEVRFQSEHAVRDYYFTTQRRSTVAMACIFNSLEQVDQESRVEILNALLYVLQDFPFDSATTLFVARSRLSALLAGNEAADEVMQVAAATVSRSSSRNSQSITRTDSDIDMKYTPVTADNSPRSVTTVSRC